MEFSRRGVAGGIYLEVVMMELTAVTSASLMLILIFIGIGLQILVYRWIERRDFPEEPIKQLTNKRTSDIISE